jgi:hypothetical protein
MSVSAITVRFDEHTMWVELTDGRTPGVPLAWFPRLLGATPAQREQVEISRTSALGCDRRGYFDCRIARRTRRYEQGG